MSNIEDDGFLSKPLTDEEIQKANVGEVKEHNSDILLEEYNNQWPVIFKRQKG